MRTALLLLFGLALTAIPGSLIPQRPVDPIAVGQFRSHHPDVARWYDRFELFDVFASPWFSAVYLLLMISLIGCVVPRSKVYLSAVRARPPATPRYLDRLPEHRSLIVEASVESVLATAAKSLRGRRFRVDTDPSVGRRRTRLPARHRQPGLPPVAGGDPRQHRLRPPLRVQGQRAGRRGHGFSRHRHPVRQPAGRSAVRHRPPAAVRTEDGFLRRPLQTDGRRRGAARLTATSAARPVPPRKSRQIRSNHPLAASSTKVFLGPHGYAPLVTVRDGRGDLVFTGPVPFLPVDPVGLSSRGVIKVPDAAPTQLGFQGFFLPTAAFDMQRGPFSTFPQPLNPRLVLNVWSGDLRTRQRRPQSVCRLDTSHMTQVRRPPTSARRRSPTRCPSAAPWPCPVAWAR